MHKTLYIGHETYRYTAIEFFFPKLQLSSKIWQICPIFLPIIAKTEKDNPEWSPILQLALVLGCLTSVIWPLTLTVLIVGSCLCYANISHYKAVNFNFFHKEIIGSPTWMPQLGKFAKFYWSAGVSKKIQISDKNNLCESL